MMQFIQGAAKAAAPLVVTGLAWVAAQVGFDAELPEGTGQWVTGLIMAAVVYFVPNRQAD